MYRFVFINFDGGSTGVIYHSGGSGQKLKLSQDRRGWSILCRRHIRLFEYLDWLVGLPSID